MPLSISQIIGSVLTVFGIGVFATSIVFLKFANNQYINSKIFHEGFFHAIDNNERAYSGDFEITFVRSLPIPYPFEEPTLTTYIRNGNVPDQFKENHQKFLKTTKMIDSELAIWCYIPKFRIAAILAIATSLFQVIVSLFYIFWKEKTIKSMSFIFYSYLTIFLIHLTCMCIVLNVKPNRKYAIFSQAFYKRQKADIFAAFLGLNCLTIIASTVLTCLKCDTENYADRCIDEETSNRARNKSGANILSSRAFSTDRLNK